MTIPFLPDLRGGGDERIHIELTREITLLGHNVEFALMCVVSQGAREVFDTRRAVASYDAIYRGFAPAP